MKWTLIFTFFRSLTLAHLERSLYSLSKQTVKPDEWLFFDNNTAYSEEEIRKVISQHFRLEDWKLNFEKHGDPKKTSASWCQNQAILRSSNETFVLTKADCIYDFTFCQRLLELHQGLPMRFVAAWMYQMGYLSQKSHQEVDHAADLEPLNWRENPRNLDQNKANGRIHDAPDQDAASFCCTRDTISKAGWYDEYLLGWGFWQMDLQSQLRLLGVPFIIIKEILSWHMMHDIEGPERNLERAYAEWQRSPRRGK